MRDLTRGPISRTLALFALPVLGSNILQSLNGSINALWVGRFLGEAGLTATSNANLVLFLLLGTIFGVGMAATIMVGHAFGARDPDRAKRVVGTSAAFFAAVSALFAVAGYLLTDSILRLLGTPADALPMAQAYLQVIFVAVPAMNFLSFLMTVLRGAGDSRTPFVFMGLAVVLDVFMNPLLILGIGPLPRLGIAGSAWATLISQLVATAAILTLLYARRHPLRLAGRELAYLRPDPAILRAVITKGVPMGLQMIVISASALIMIGLVNSFGSRVAAAYGVAAQLWTYVQMPALAIGAAVSSMAAQNVGAGRWDRVGRITRAGIMFNLVLTGVLALVLVAADRVVIGWFLPTDSAAVDIAIHINLLAVWSFILFGVTIVLFGTVRATGAVIPPLMILAASLFVARVFFAYGFQDRLGADAVWLSFPVGSGVSVVLALAYYVHGGWRKAHMTADRPAAGEPPDTGYGLARQRAVNDQPAAGDGTRREGSCRRRWPGTGLQPEQRPDERHAADRLIGRQASDGGDEDEQRRLGDGRQPERRQMVAADDDQRLVDDVEGKDRVGQIAQQRRRPGQMPGGKAEDGGDRAPLVDRIDDAHQLAKLLGRDRILGAVDPGVGSKERIGRDCEAERRPAMADEGCGDGRRTDRGEAEQEGRERDGMIVPVVDERVGDLEIGKQEEAQDAEEDDRPDDQPPAVECLRQRRFQPVNQRPRQPEQQCRDKRVDEQIGDEPQMVPGRHDQAVAVQAEAAVAGQIFGEEGEIAGIIAKLLDDLVIGLRRHDHQHAKEKRRQQPRRPRPRQPAGRELVRHEAGRSARDDEQQGQPPRVGEEHQRLDRMAGGGALHVPVPAHVEHADVIEDQQPEGRNPDPVEVVLASLR